MAQYKPIPDLTTDQVERFWNTVSVHNPSGCWEWTGTILRDGYGQFYARPFGAFMAHRVAMQLLIGDVSVNHQIDHLCRNHRCVNPDHLQVVTPKVNTLRGYSPSSANHRKTHCKNGHEFTSENTLYFPSQNGRRTCRTCWQAISAKPENRERRRLSSEKYARSEQGQAYRAAYRQSERGKQSMRDSASRYRARKRLEQEKVSE